VSSYLTVSPLPNELGGLLSVALSCGSPQVDVIHHSALRSPDFPRVSGIKPETRDHPTDSSIDKSKTEIHKSKYFVSIFRCEDYSLLFDLNSRGLGKWLCITVASIHKNYSASSIFSRHCNFPASLNLYVFFLFTNLHTNKF
jgi:hypothetical protein